MRIGFSPAAGLVAVHSALSAGVHGVVNEVCDWLGDNSVVTRIYSISSYEIQKALDQDNNFRWTYDGTNFWTQTVVADITRLGIHLPHGAIVTALRVYGQADTLVAYVSLEAQTRSTGFPVPLGSITMTSSMEEISNESLSDATIDNDLRNYYIDFSVSGTPGEVRIRGIQIDYTVVKPQP